jgi:hypothetical protein
VTYSACLSFCSHELTFTRRAQVDAREEAPSSGKDPLDGPASRLNVLVVYLCSLSPSRLLLHTVAVDIRDAFQSSTRESFSEKVPDDSALPPVQSLRSDPIASATALQLAYTSYRQSREKTGFSGTV